MSNIRPANNNDIKEVYQLITELEETEIDFAAFSKVYTDNMMLVSKVIFQRL